MVIKIIYILENGSTKYFRVALKHNKASNYFQNIDNKIRIRNTEIHDMKNILHDEDLIVNPNPLCNGWCPKSRAKVVGLILYLVCQVYLRLTSLNLSLLLLYVFQ